MSLNIDNELEKSWLDLQSKYPHLAINKNHYEVAWLDGFKVANTYHSKFLKRLS